MHRRALVTALAGGLAGCTRLGRSTPSGVQCDSDVSDASAASQVTGAWPRPHFDSKNTGYNPDATGVSTCPEVRWSHSIGETTIRSPVIANGTFFVAGFPNTLRAFDLASGEPRWTLSLDGIGYNPVVHDGVVYVGGGAHLYAIDIETQAIRWAIKVGRSNGPAFVDDMVISAGGDGVVRAIDIDDGSVEWQHDAGRTEKLRFRAPPAVADGTVFAGHENGNLYALDLASGALRWRRNLGAQIESAPAVVGDVVYVNADQPFALDAETGTTLWRGSQTWGVTLGAPAVADAVYVTAGRTLESMKLRALDRETGAEHWSTNVGLPEASPAVAAGSVYVGLSGTFYSFDATDGTMQWWLELTTDIIATPALLSGMVVITDGDGNLFALG
ncbi:PQQ-binding-like beta-propeller repeat protein [Haloarchaeobius sp. DYHT-AS-18]|uniref:outer membrane protein assembly factor BamB family protein n=1 Tax=Haloarchaeobius sp. DYHT-AS-18 TaxID=3446117 RepID=UPI003EBCBFC9